MAISGTLLDPEKLFGDDSDHPLVNMMDTTRMTLEQVEALKALERSISKAKSSTSLLAPVMIHGTVKCRCHINSLTNKVRIVEEQVRITSFAAVKNLSKSGLITK